MCKNMPPHGFGSRIVEFSSVFLVKPKGNTYIRKCTAALMYIHTFMPVNAFVSQLKNRKAKLLSKTEIKFPSNNPNNFLGSYYIYK